MIYPEHLLLTQLTALSFHLSKTLESDPSPSWGRGIGQWPDKEWLPFFDLDFNEPPIWILDCMGYPKGTDVNREHGDFEKQQQDIRQWKLIFYKLCLAKDWNWKQWSETTFLQPLWDLKLEKTVAHPISDIQACLRQLKTKPELQREVWSPFSDMTLAQQLPHGLQTSIDILLQDDRALKQGTVRAAREFLRRFFQTFFSIVDHYNGLVQRFISGSNDHKNLEDLFHNLHQTQKVVLVFLQACRESVVLNTRLQWARYCALSGLAFADIPHNVGDRLAIVRSAKKAKLELVELFREKEGLDFELMPRLHDLEQLLNTLQDGIQSRLGDYHSDILDWVMLHDHTKDSLNTLELTRRQTLEALSAEFKDFAFFLSDSDKQAEKKYRVFSTMLDEWCGDDKQRPFAGQCVFVSRNIHHLLWTYYHYATLSEQEKNKRRPELSEALVLVVKPLSRLLGDLMSEINLSMESAVQDLRWVITFLEQFHLDKLIPILFQGLAWGLKSRAYEPLILNYVSSLSDTQLLEFRDQIGQSVAAYPVRHYHQLENTLNTIRPKHGKKWNSAPPLQLWASHCRSYVLQLPMTFWKRILDGKDTQPYRQLLLLDAIVSQCEPKSHALELLEAITSFWPEKPRLILMVWLANRKKAIPKTLLTQTIQLESVLSQYMASSSLDFLEYFWLSQQFYYPLSALKQAMEHQKAMPLMDTIVTGLTQRQNNSLRVFSQLLVSVADDPYFIDKCSSLWQSSSGHLLKNSQNKRTVWNFLIAHFRKTSARERLALSTILTDWAVTLGVTSEEVLLKAEFTPSQLIQDYTPLVALSTLLKSCIQTEDDLKWDGLTLSFSEPVKARLLDIILSELENWLTFMPFMVTHELSMTISRLKKQDFRGIVGTLSTFKAIVTQATKTDTLSKDTLGFLQVLGLTLENLVTISDLWGAIPTLLDSDIPEFMADRWQNADQSTDPFLGLFGLMLSFTDHSQDWSTLWIKSMAAYRPDWVSHWMRELTDPNITATVLTRLIECEDPVIQNQLLAELDTLVEKAAWALSFSTESQRESNQKLARVFHHVTKNKEAFDSQNRLFLAYLQKLQIRDTEPDITEKPVAKPVSAFIEIKPIESQPEQPELAEVEPSIEDTIETIPAPTSVLLSPELPNPEEKTNRHKALHTAKQAEYSWSDMLADLPRLSKTLQAPKKYAPIPTMHDIKKAYTFTWDMFSSQVPLAWHSSGVKVTLKIGACWYLMLTSSRQYRTHWDVISVCLLDILSSRDLSRFTSKNTRKSGLWRRLYLKRVAWEYTTPPEDSTQALVYKKPSKALFERYYTSSPNQALMILLNSLAD